LASLYFIHLYKFLFSYTFKDVDSWYMCIFSNFGNSWLHKWNHIKITNLLN
jgi:hypothetical protein